MDSMGFGDSNGMTAGNKYDILNSFLQKIQNFYSHQNNNNENDQEEEVEEDPIDEPEEEETSPQKQVNANYDSLEDVSDKSNEWRKQDPELVNELARSDKGLWNSENRNQEAENIAILAALEDNIWAINRPVTIIEVEVGDSNIASDYADNLFWTKSREPSDAGISVDDLLKEIEGI